MLRIALERYYKKHIINKRSVVVTAYAMADQVLLTEKTK
ncbi:hypothetical protein SAMN05216167_14319 [Spirosoma endophyticum]|uniref:Uncharacterized protein n=1 Tax=Spirosoma endophyticum TaxID=662367 RepID=A0A1I2HF73_9BACT|nr:hypothetical protein SAMN05216167_14319 [Spirosoma endophyticum]